MLDIFNYVDESDIETIEPVFDPNTLRGIASKERWKDADYRKKLSDKHKERWKHDDLRERMSIAHTGLKHTQETKDKIGAVHRGKKVSQETRSKLRQVAKNRAKKYAYHTPIGIFYTAEEAAKHYDLTNDGLIYRCVSKSKKNEKFVRERLDKHNESV